MTPPPPDPGQAEKPPETPAAEQTISRGQHAQRRARMWMAPGIRVKRWLTLFVICTLVGAVGFLHFTWTGPWHFAATRWILWLNQFANPGLLPLSVTGGLMMLLALGGALYSIAMLNRSILRGMGTAPETTVDVLYERRTLSRGPRIIALGGGTGLSNLLTGLKKYTGNITAVVTVADDGGSSGRLREALDMVAPGDLTDCYAALSDSPVLARLLLHRFERGEGIQGHTFGNLLLATLSEEQGGSLATAMQDIHEVLRVRGAVFPATTAPATLQAHLSDGRVVRGESQFATQVGAARIERVTLDPPNLPALPQVIEAIANAELIVLGPGSLFTSIIPALIVPEIAGAIRRSAAPVVYVASIMTEPGETTHFTLADHFRAIIQHLHRTPDYVLMNKAPVDSAVLQRYQSEGAELLDTATADNDLRKRVRLASLLQPGTAWHSPEALAQALLELSPKQR